MKAFLAIAFIAAIAANLSACNLYTPGPDGGFTFSPGFDYSSGNKTQSDADNNDGHRPY